MDLVLTNQDPCNADYLDARTLAPLFRVTTLSKKRSSLNRETTVIQVFRSAAQQAQTPTHAHTHIGQHGGYAASPYGAPTLAMPQPHQSQSRPQSPQPTSQGPAQPATTCQIEWHSVKDTQFHWTDSRGKIGESKMIDSSGFMQRKRKFKTHDGRTYIWFEDGTLQSEAKAHLGSIFTSPEDLQKRWDTQPASALRWGAVLSLVESVPREDIGDIVAVLAYCVAKTRKNAERDKAMGKLGGTMQSVAS